MNDHFLIASAWSQESYDHPFDKAVPLSFELFAVVLSARLLLFLPVGV